MEESFEGKTRRQISGQKTFLEERIKASKRRAPENIRRLHLQWLQSLRLFHDQRRKVLQGCKCQNVPPPTFRSLSHMCAPIYASAKSAGSPAGPNGQRLASNALLVLSVKSLCCGPLLVSLCFLHVPPRRSRTYSLALLSLPPIPRALVPSLTHHFHSTGRREGTHSHCGGLPGGGQVSRVHVCRRVRVCGRPRVLPLCRRRARHGVLQQGSHRPSKGAAVNVQVVMPVSG